jgi:hypothetical protein
LATLLRLHGRPVPAAPVARPVPARRMPTTCQNVSMCHTRSTSRKCSYPGGCSANVCRTCKMCASHFQFFNPVALHAEPREIWD